MPCSRSLLLLCLFLGFLHACGGGGGDGGGAGAPGQVAPPPAIPAPDSNAQLPLLTAITLQSEAGDPLGEGRSYRYTRSDAQITVKAEGNRLIVLVEGDEQWTGVFQTGGEGEELKAGQYLSMARYRDGMPASQSAMTWWGNGRSCSSATGWAVIDSVEYANRSLASVSLRFARYCNGAAAALRGEVKYSANDRSGPASPVAAIPPDLWRPPAAVSATRGNWAYFESGEGDYVGLGQTVLFDPRAATVTVELDGTSEHILVSVTGDDVWSAEIRTVAGLDRMTAGYYPGVKGARFHNPAKGGMSWTAAGRGCATSTGWYAVDAVTTEPNGEVRTLDLRFEQHCEGRAAVLRGAIHYVRPVPATANPALSQPGSWRAPAAFVPASENFFYTERELGSPLEAGRRELQSSRNAAFDVTASGNELVFHGTGVREWGIRFQGPARLSQLVPGIYDGVTARSADGGSFGSLWVSEGSYGCEAERGWVSVDHAVYSAGKLAAIELRFELACYGGTAGHILRRGHLRWRADVPDSFPGPVAAPATFWRPAPALPAGTSVYLSSDPSDFVGIGEVLYTPLNAAIAVREGGGKLTVQVDGDTEWSGSFDTMRTAGKLLPGYYAGLGELPNAARGNFRWGGDARGCNEAVSGVVVDSAVYHGDTLTELKLRFEQHCQNEPGALRGQVHWFASDTRLPAGPAQVEPAALWRAPAGALPQSGNYIYVEFGRPGRVDQDRKWLLTSGNASFRVNQQTILRDIPGSYLHFFADTGTSDGGRFDIEFQTMRPLGQLQPGFYDHLQVYPFHNTSFGGLDINSHWGGGCAPAMGWMMLDKVVYTNGRLSLVHGRFMQVCDMEPTDIWKGEFHWEG